jgi:glycosyltransferase involved in cell wall biosynthesis
MHATQSASFKPMNSASPLVSVVIPGFNHGRFIGEAINSVMAQSHARWELLVVDDGSRDETASVVRKFPQARYIHQANQGLPAARNTGLRFCHGEFVVFLDADDRLLPNALAAGVACFAQNPECALVSGRHSRVMMNGTLLSHRESPQPEAGHYVALLKGNYIGMHATVMYRRAILESAGGFDVQLPACEDYDVYLRIARVCPVATHAELTAEYRIHDDNMSGDIGLMLPTVLAVLERQRMYVAADPMAWAALEAGRRAWRKYYANEMLMQWRLRKQRQSRPSTWQLIRVLGRHAPGFFPDLLRRRMESGLRRLWRTLTRQPVRGAVTTTTQLPATECGRQPLGRS